MTLGAKSARATRPPCTAISTVRCTTSNSRRSRIAVCKQSASESGQRRDLRWLGDADRLIAFQPDGQVQSRQGHELGLGGGVELLAHLRLLNLGSQDGFALDDALALALASVREFLVGAAKSVLCGPPQRLAPEDVVVCDRDLVGHRLVGAIGLELERCRWPDVPARSGPADGRSQGAATEP